jgi:hemerythrin-like domain-containing protein
MNDPISAWHAEHVYFGHLLDLLGRELDAFHRGSRPNYELAHDIITYLRDYADQYHHPREDRVFERLARRCPDLQLVVARLRRQHRAIEDAGEALLRQIDAILEDAMAPRAQLESSLAAYLEHYRRHIADENEMVLGRAAGELTAEDWEAVTAAPAPQAAVGHKSVEHFRELRRQIALEA